MKVKALVTVNYNHKLKEPGAVFECDEEQLPALLAVGAVEPVAAKEKQDTKAEKA